MRLDVVTIFADYLAPLQLSLIGKAQAQGLLDVRVHDLREHTHDRHRTVDDTPYGGGAGLLMKPEPWGEALDAVLADPPVGAREEGPVLVVPSPVGEVFSQRAAVELAAEPWLVFACGRYEGIDARVVEHYRTRIRVREVSLGDYVLNGGEVAVLAITEAVVRLVPGVVGNAAPSPRRATPPSTTGCWSTPPTPSRPPGAASTSRPCWPVATTGPSSAGGGTRRCGAPRPAVPTWWSGWTRPAATRGTSPSSPSWAGRPVITDSVPRPPLWQTDQLTPTSRDGR